MGSPGLLAIVTPAEFRKRTSLRLSSRSGTTLALDKAYDDYYSTRSEENRKALYAQLSAYRKAHGGSWNKCDRNAVSGGLLEYLHNTTYSGALSPAAAAALDKKVAANIRDVEIPHARYGVLYLLGNVRLEMDPVGMAIEGAGLIGGAIGAGVTTHFNELGSATKGTRAALTVKGQGVSAPRLAWMGAKAVDALGKDGIESAVAAATKPAAAPAPAVSFESTVANALPLTATALRIASLGLSTQWNKNKYLGAVAYVGAAAVAVPATALAAVGDAGFVLWEKLKKAFDKLSQILMTAWRARYDLSIAEKLGMLLKKGVVIAIDLIMKNAVPFLSGAVDIGTGVVRTISEACTRIASWNDRRHIRIRSGHPEEIANSIEHEMTLGVCGGLGAILKGASSVALSVFLPGLGSLVSAVISAVEWLVKLFSRLAEQFAIERFLEQARKYYEDEVKRSTLVDGVRQPNTEPGSLITNDKKFADFFREGCNASPLIPMLTLNAGLGGSLWTMIELFDTNGAQSTTLHRGRKEFDIGGDYFSRLKYYSVNYMKKSGFKIMPMATGDKGVAGFLTHAQGTQKTGPRSHVAPASWGGRAVSALAG
ncbi:hypothetical protein [Pararobbsia alpina]|uniref:Uncharacterized protein n=1 Tax=Pararobbsia alpina TaxID=621374 RepID=A0A6S7B3Z6_9BURK|nr:hypothetical protein [Pararobbsia alpina]CAB3777254.1 hypothetical protein LMG28138_00329 [Pararobbsia alpina]